MKMPAILFTMFVSASSVLPNSYGDALDLCDFKIEFSDEFNDLSISSWELNGKRWMAHTPWRGDFGDAAFSDPGPDGPFSLQDGVLRITARRDPSGTWRSGLIAAADASGKGAGIRYGYFEARMRMPPGPGTWPAFWLSSLKPTASKSPAVEIDVVEYYGHDDASYQSVWHVWFKRQGQEHLNRSAGKKIDVPAGSLVNAFHDYGVQVTPGWITYYLDGKAVFKARTPPELKTPLYPLVNLALGSGYPIDRTPNPSVLLVDHVRIYRNDPAGRRLRCPGAQP